MTRNGEKMKGKNRLPYERPRATFVELKPEERLLYCGKRPGNQFCKTQPETKFT